jgi:hypothetical protein
MIKKRVKRGVKIALLVPVGLAAVAVFGFIVMYLWNWLAPAVFAPDDHLLAGARSADPGEDSGWRTRWGAWRRQAWAPQHDGSGGSE